VAEGSCGVTQGAPTSSAHHEPAWRGLLICLETSGFSTFVNLKQRRADWMRLGFSQLGTVGVANPATNRQTGSNRGARNRCDLTEWWIAA
jgi:hypothetical protein